MADHYHSEGEKKLMKGAGKMYEGLKRMAGKMKVKAGENQYKKAGKNLATKDTKGFKFGGN
jgi:hypothetical protein